MVRDFYEITVEIANGDCPYMRLDCEFTDFHRAVITGLDFAYQKRGKLIRIEKIGVEVGGKSVEEVRRILRGDK